MTTPTTAADLGRVARERFETEFSATGNFAGAWSAAAHAVAAAVRAESAAPDVDLECQELQTAGGIWRVLKRGDEVCIADPQGRQRHRSRGHVNTALHLAMQLDRNEFHSLPNLDETLRMAVEQFVQGDTPSAAAHAVERRVGEQSPEQASEIESLRGRIETAAAHLDTILRYVQPSVWAAADAHTCRRVVLAQATAASEILKEPTQ